MEAERHRVELDHLAVLGVLDRRLAAEAAAEQPGAVSSAQVRVAPGTGVIAVRMGDDRARHRLPGIDVESAGGAEEAGRRFDQHLCELYWQGFRPLAIRSISRTETRLVVSFGRATCVASESRDRPAFARSATARPP